MKMKNLWEGILKKNPVFVLALGLVPAVAVTSTAFNGLALGLITAGVFLVATLIDYALVLFLPVNARLAVRMLVLIALVVAVLGILLGQNPGLVAGLGIFLPLVVANSVLVHSFREQETFGAALLRALGEGLGFVLALVLIGVIREFLGLGAIFGRQILTGSLPPLSLASGVPGGLIILGLLLAVANKLTKQGGELHD